MFFIGNNRKKHNIWISKNVNQMFGQPSERCNILCGELHNMSMRPRCLMDMKEDALHDLGRCEGKLCV